MSRSHRGVMLLPLIVLGLLLARVGVCAPPNVLFVLADDMGLWAARLAPDSCMSFPDLQIWSTILYTCRTIFLYSHS